MCIKVFIVVKWGNQLTCSAHKTYVPKWQSGWTMTLKNRFTLNFSAGNYIAIYNVNLLFTVQNISMLYIHFNSYKCGKLVERWNIFPFVFKT